MMREAKNSPTDIIVVCVSSELKALIPPFLANRRDDACNIFKAVEREDYQKIRGIGHGMKGVGGGYGFDVISRLGLALEMAAAAEDIRGIEKLAAQLTDFLNRVEVVFDNGGSIGEVGKANMPVSFDSLK